MPPRSRPAEGAAEILDAEVARIRPEALRSRAGYDARQALAHAAAGEVEHARADDAPTRHHLRPAPPGPDAVPR
ncbi:hypothetical protein Airi02_074150 [Actinoallomurus iriomotensis]|uniref:Uncharacterized protein n=1 Tax=Actinoallomurus iriomotensis TaxID=478107 RepID=A0A9W6S6H2_9ACTN|nr:hypothetical protein Airi02_074150 [Actinoallomurus iriomotensis]